MKAVVAKLWDGVRVFARNGHIVIGVVALGAGVLVGGGIIGFREAIDAFQRLFFNADAHDLLAALETFPWYQVLLTPVLGGVAVAVFYRFVMPGGRPQGVGQAIEAAAARRPDMPLLKGLGAAVGSALSIGGGASVGREGPAVHLGATLAAGIAVRLNFPQHSVRTLLGCGVAAAVASSFNAPIAGALFAHEVVIGHYGLAAFAPVVIASVSATMLSRWHFGDTPAFTLPDFVPPNLWEYPGFLVVGLACGVLALALMKGTFALEDLWERRGVPFLWRAPMAGFGVGLIALGAPQVLGVGYEATDAALKGQYAVGLLLLLAVAKTAATALCLGSGFGGGIFSPALTIGALLGAGLGLGMEALFPGYAAAAPAYAVIGMGALAAAVLDAPISTILIIFELTGNYGLTVGTMVAVVAASVLVHQMMPDPSFFLTLLHRNGVVLRGGPEMDLFRSLTIQDVMHYEIAKITADAPLDEAVAHLKDGAPVVLVLEDDEAERLFGMITPADVLGLDTAGRTAGEVARTEVPAMLAGDSLERAIPYLRAPGEQQIAVIEDMESRRVIGAVYENEALLFYNRALFRMKARDQGRSFATQDWPF